MITLQGKLIYQEPITTDSVIWLRVTDHGAGERNYHLVLSDTERMALVQVARQEMVLTVVGEVDTSHEWYVPHFVVASWHL